MKCVKMRIRAKTFRWILTACLLVSGLYQGPSAAGANALVPPDDPTQSIAYWKSFVIDPKQDPLAAKAHAVFEVLLRSWDSSQLAPSLYVVSSSSGPWAASLADGNILLTRCALDTIMGFGQKRAEHLLAFVLAHELAHQRSDDLWHQRFFRLLGSRDPEMKKQIQRDLQLDAQMLYDIAQKEAQADHDGLLMMASVGYDPYQIIDQKDFFTAWIENIWQDACSSEGEGTSFARVCTEAHGRALRTRAQLATVATQAMLYELGMQAFVAGNYHKARRYFKAYGRSYTNRAVLNAMGLTHLAEALTIQRQLIHEGALNLPGFYYPMLLDASVAIRSGAEEAPAQKRSARDSIFAQEKRRMQGSIAQAIEHFEKAIRLEPNHPKSYLMLACSYLLSGNSFMVRGIMQGKYIPRFGPDKASELMLAMTLAFEGEHAQSRQALRQLIDHLKKPQDPGPIPKDLLLYTAFHNSAALAQYAKQKTTAHRYWKELAQYAQSTGNGLLFQISLSRLDVATPADLLPPTVLNIDGLRLGDRIGPQRFDNESYRSNDLWIEGEQYRVLRFNNGSRFVVGPDQRIISAWQDSGHSTLSHNVSIGDKADRPIKAMGSPDRRLHLISGEYLAYDQFGVALHIDNRQVVGWFLYSSE